MILIDTGLPAGTPEEKPDEDSLAYTGKNICSYMEAFKALGYKPEQVTKILLTHKHADHSGEISSFPNAKVYVNVWKDIDYEIYIHPDIYGIYECRITAWSNILFFDLITDGGYGELPYLIVKSSDAHKTHRTGTRSSGHSPGQTAAFKRYSVCPFALRPVSF